MTFTAFEVRFNNHSLEMLPILHERVRMGLLHTPYTHSLTPKQSCAQPWVGILSAWCHWGHKSLSRNVMGSSPWGRGAESLKNGARTSLCCWNDLVGPVISLKWPRFAAECLCDVGQTMCQIWSEICLHYHLLERPWGSSKTAPISNLWCDHCYLDLSKGTKLA